MVERASIKEAAKRAMKPNWGVAVGTTIVTSLILGAGTATAGIASFILSGVLNVGLSIAFLHIYRNQQCVFEDLFKGFNNFGTTCVAGILTQLYTFLWSLLFIVPGIVKALSYAMTPYILADNPDMSSQDAIKASQDMMNGHKWDLFVLYLSFLGWYILSAFTAGILAILYVNPYVATSVAGFYDAIKDENQNYAQPDQYQGQ